MVQVAIVSLYVIIAQLHVIMYVLVFLRTEYITIGPKLIVHVNDQQQLTYELSTGEFISVCKQVRVSALFTFLPDNLHVLRCYVHRSINVNLCHQKVSQTLPNYSCTLLYTYILYVHICIQIGYAASVGAEDLCIKIHHQGHSV